MIPNAQIAKAIGTTVSAILKQKKKIPEPAIRLAIEGSLLVAEYNLNHKVNMIILPCDQEIAQSVKLPRHLATACSMSHESYSDNVYAKAHKIFTKFEEKADKELCKSFKLNGKSVKDKLNEYSGELFDIIRDWGKKCGGNELDEIPDEYFEESNDDTEF